MAMLAAAPARAVAGKAAGKVAKKAATARKSSGAGAGRRGGKPKNLPSTGPDGAPSTGGPKPPPTAEQGAADLLSDLGGQFKGLGTDARDNLTLTPPSLRKLNAGDASGFAFGLVAYCLFINYLKYGPAGVRGWIAAKFINKPLTGVPK